MDPLGKVNRYGKLPRSSKTWNAALRAARQRRQRITPPPSGDEAFLDAYPYELLEVRNAQNVRIEPGTLCHVQFPSGVLPFGNFETSKFHQLPVIFPASGTIAEPAASSFVRVLDRIERGNVGRAVLLGHLPDGVLQLGPRRHWAGKPFVGIPFVNQAKHESQPFTNVEADWITVPASGNGGSFSGVPGTENKPASIDGLEFIPLRDVSRTKSGRTRFWDAYQPVHPCRLVGTLTMRLFISRPRVNLRSGFLYGDCELIVAINGNPFVPTNPDHFAQRQTVAPVLLNRCIRQFSGSGFDINFNNSPLQPDGSAGSVPPENLREFRTFVLPFTLGRPDPLFAGDIYWTVIFQRGRNICPVLPTVKIAGCMVEFLEIDRDDSRDRSGNPLSPFLGNRFRTQSSEMGPNIRDSSFRVSASAVGESTVIKTPLFFLRNGQGSATLASASLFAAGTANTGAGPG
jgi:hypothetical protein